MRNVGRIYGFAVCLFLITPATVLLAQEYAVDRGSVLLDGQASFTSTGTSNNSSDDERVTQLILNPGVQYFFLPGLAVGGEVILSRTSYRDNATTSYGVGPAITYFFTRGERTIYPFVSANLSLRRTRFNDGGDARTMTNYRGSGGALLMLSRSVGLTGELFYQGQHTSDEFDANTFGLAFGIAAFVF